MTAEMVKSVGGMVISRVIDLGVGDGSVVEEIIRLLGVSPEIYGLDIDENVLSIAKGRGIKVVKV